MYILFSPYDKEIIRLAVPNIISNISIPILGSIDLAIVGHLQSDVYIGAVALGTMIFNFIYWGFGFLRMSTSGYTAQAFGRNNFSEQQKFLLQGIVMALTLALIVLFLQGFIVKFAFYLLDATKSTENLAADYFFIRVWAAPATLSLYVLYGWLLGMQNAKSPMIIAILGSLFNTIFSYLLAYWAQMNSSGVALGTVFAQYLSLLIAILLVWKQYPEHLKNLIQKAYLKWGEIILFFKLNIDIFVRTLGIIAVFSFFTSSSASQSDQKLALNTLLLQFFMFFSFFEDGFAFAAEAIVGKYLGQNLKCDMIIRIKRIFFWGFLVSLLFSASYFFWSSALLTLLTNQHQIIGMAPEFNVYIVLIPLFSFASFLWDGIYIGATASREMRNTMILATFLVFFPVYYISNNILGFGNHSIWISLLLFLLTRGIAQTILALRYK